MQACSSRATLWQRARIMQRQRTLTSASSPQAHDRTYARGMRWWWRGGGGDSLPLFPCSSCHVGAALLCSSFSSFHPPTHTHSLSLSRPLDLSTSRPLSTSLSTSLYLSRPLDLSTSLSRPLSRPLSTSRPLDLSTSLSLSLSIQSCRVVFRSPVNPASRSLIATRPSSSTLSRPLCSAPPTSSLSSCPTRPTFSPTSRGRSLACHPTACLGAAPSSIHQGSVVCSGCWLLGTGCWVLGAGCWVLGVGCWETGQLEGNV